MTTKRTFVYRESDTIVIRKNRSWEIVAGENLRDKSAYRERDQHESQQETKREKR